MHLLTNNWKSDLHKLAIGGAWLFAVCSLVPLLWLGLEPNTGSSRVFGAEVNGVVHTAWGLAYTGIPGTILLWIELLLVSAAIGATAAPAKFVPTRWRRAGHGVLVGWAALWSAGLVHLAGVNPGFFAVQTLFVTALLGCTLYRAWLDWSPKDRNDDAPTSSLKDPFDLNPPDQNRTSPPTDVAAEETLMLALRDVQASRSMQEVVVATQPTTAKQRAMQVLARTFDREALRHAASRTAHFTAETCRATANVSKAIGRRFIAAAKAWKSYDGEETSARA